MKALRLLAAGLFQRTRMERDMAEELAVHIEHRTDDLARSGCPRAEAARRARMEFGALENYKESCREARGLAWFDELRGNLRFTVRSLRASPGYTLAAVLSLAIGIGANLCAFITVNAIMLHPFPFPHLDRIMLLGESDTGRDPMGRPVAAGNFFDWQQNNRSFESLAAFHGWDALVNGAGEPERVTAARVSADFFATLGVAPASGRGFTGEEFQPGSDAVAVVSQAFQKSHVMALGRSILLDGRPHTVIGVMPGDFDFPLATEVWVPLALSPAAKARRDAADLGAIGRLKAEVSVSQARAEMAALASTLARRFPETNRDRGVSVRPLGEFNEISNRFVTILWFASGFVLLLACANIGNLQLARFTARQKEMGLRAALGASRFRLVRQLITEGLVVSAAGGLLGVYFANVELSLLKKQIPAQVLHWVAGMRNFRMDPLALVCAFAVSIAAGIVCSLPANYQLLRQRSGGGLSEVLKEAGRGTVASRAGDRARAVLVAGEMALALVLLVGAVLMVRTFERMLAVNAGVDPKGVLTLEVTPSPNAYRNDVETALYYRRVLAEMDTLSGVQAAALSGWAGSANWQIEGRDKPAPGELRPDAQAISARYLQTMRIPVLAGRSIGEQDGPDAMRAAVISETVARYYWRGSSPIGQRIRLGGPSSPWLTIVGVCADVRDWFGGEAQPKAYLSYRQNPPQAVRFELRTAGDPMQSAGAARAALRRVDPNQAIYNVKSMEQILAEETSGVKSAATVMSIDAAIALLLALMGGYAVSAFLVAQRTQEIGVRVALGASPRTIVRMIVAQTGRSSAVGLAVGLSVSLALSLVMSHSLYNVVAMEPLTFVAVTALLAASALLAAFVPARRAARLDPMTALRSE